VESPAELNPRINQTTRTPPRRNFIPLHCSPVDCSGRKVEPHRTTRCILTTSSLFLSSPIVRALVVVTTEGQPWSGLLHSLEGHRRVSLCHCENRQAGVRVGLHSSFASTLSHSHQFPASLQEDNPTWLFNNGTYQVRIESLCPGARVDLHILTSCRGSKVAACWFQMKYPFRYI
jgi:hypothetical protein